MCSHRPSSCTLTHTHSPVHAHSQDTQSLYTCAHTHIPSAFSHKHPWMTGAPSNPQAIVKLSNILRQGAGQNHPLLRITDPDTPYPTPPHTRACSDRARSSAPAHLHTFPTPQSTCLDLGLPSTACSLAAAPAPRGLSASFPPSQAAGAWPGPGTRGGCRGRRRMASFPVRCLAHGRGECGSNLQLIKCPSLMSFFN